MSYVLSFLLGMLGFYLKDRFGYRSAPFIFWCVAAVLWSLRQLL